MNAYNCIFEFLESNMIFPLFAYNFFRTLVFIIGFYYLFKILGRIFRPYLIKYINKKAQERFGGQFQNQQRQKTYQGKRPKEGETVIDKMPNSSKKSNNDVGEYVDFEEVD